VGVSASLACIRPLNQPPDTIFDAEGVLAGSRLLITLAIAVLHYCLAVLAVHYFCLLPLQRYQEASRRVLSRHTAIEAQGRGV